MLPLRTTHFSYGVSYVLGHPDMNFVKAINQSRCGMPDPIPISGRLAAFKEATVWRKEKIDGGLMVLSFSYVTLFLFK